MEDIQEAPQAQYYADFDGVGNISAFYVSDIHGDSIPETAQPITEEEWREYIANGGQDYKWDGEAVRLKTQAEKDEEAAQLPAPPKSTEKELEETKTALAEAQTKISDLSQKIAINEEITATTSADLQAFMEYMLTPPTEGGV